MSKYSKGADFERKVKHLLEEDGCFVVRSAGSKGIVDLVSFNPVNHNVLFIQCKTNGVLSKCDRVNFVTLADNYGGVPVLASKYTSGGVLLSVVF